MHIISANLWSVKGTYAPAPSFGAAVTNKSESWGGGEEKSYTFTTSVSLASGYSKFIVAALNGGGSSLSISTAASSTLIGSIGSSTGNYYLYYVTKSASNEITFSATATGKWSGNQNWYRWAGAQFIAVPMT